jgi:hypothetical protein
MCEVTINSLLSQDAFSSNCNRMSDSYSSLSLDEKSSDVDSICTDCTEPKFCISIKSYKKLKHIKSSIELLCEYLDKYYKYINLCKIMNTTELNKIKSIISQDHEIKTIVDNEMYRYDKMYKIIMMIKFNLKIMIQKIESILVSIDININEHLAQYRKNPSYKISTIFYVDSDIMNNMEFIYKLKNIIMSEHELSSFTAFIINVPITQCFLDKKYFELYCDLRLKTLRFKNTPIYNLLNTLKDLKSVDIEQNPILKAISQIEIFKSQIIKLNEIK